MKLKHFKSFEGFFNPKQDKKPKKKLKPVKALKNYEETERQEGDRYKLIEEVGKRAASSVQEYNLDSPTKN